MLYDYLSEEATSSGQCSNNDCPQAIVSSNPLSGAQVNFPTYVQLTSDVPGAVIRYTIDGTEPDTLSAIYTEPILIASAGVMLRAIAHAEGCAQGSEAIMTVMFSNPVFPFVFSYSCDTPDKGGTWGVFTPNGFNDHHWVAQFTLTGAQTIKRLELYQLDALGNWTTGQVWSTGNPINPPELDEPFEVFPLLVFIAAVQQWAAYQTTLGSYGAGSHTWDLYGDIVTPASGLFRLDIILGDDTKLSQTIDAITCTATPPLCPPPAAPIASGACDGGVEVLFTGPVGRDYIIYARSNVCSDGSWSQVASGNIDASPKTVEITALVEGCAYEFYVSIDAVGCGFRDSSPSNPTIPFLAPVVTISTNKTLVDPNESFTISWTSGQIGGATCGGCPDGQVSIDNGIGCKAGNGAGSQAQSQSTPGIYTYQITGCNSCGTAIATVQVQVRDLATCAGPQPTYGRLAGASLFLCDFLGACGTLFFNEPVIWDGIIPLTSSCHYQKVSSDHEVFGCVQQVGTIWNGIRGDVEIGFDNSNPLIPFWWIQISAQTSGPSEVVWYGVKLLGSTPLGTYNKTGGCASNPASVTIGL